MIRWETTNFSGEAGALWIAEARPSREHDANAAGALRRADRMEAVAHHGDLGACELGLIV